MPAAVLRKTFNIPYSGGKATVMCLFKYSSSDNPSIVKYSVSSVQCHDGGGTGFGTADKATLMFSVNNGVMTVTLNYTPGIEITDCRCCLIPGDPFA